MDWKTDVWVQVFPESAGWPPDFGISIVFPSQWATVASAPVRRAPKQLRPTAAFAFPLLPPKLFRKFDNRARAFVRLFEVAAISSSFDG